MEKNKIYWGSPEAEQALKAAFSENKAVLAETDTVWGLLIPATLLRQGFEGQANAGAAELDRLKKRRDKPYLVLMGSLEAVEAVVQFPPNGSYELAKKAWPGPLTLLLPVKHSVARRSQRRRRVGIRVPDHEPLRHAAELYSGLFSTSANLSGEPVPTALEDIPASIRTEVGAIIYNDPHYTPHTQPSTIVDCSGSKLKIVRKGAYSIADIAT